MIKICRINVTALLRLLRIYRVNIPNMKKETTSLLFVVAIGIAIFAVILVFFAGSREDISEFRQNEYEHNRKHCAQYNKVYIQKDPFSKGECMDIGDASKALIEMHDSNVNKGLK